MPTFICLLRSVNVLGKNMIQMPELAGAFRKAGFRNVSTYIQSGNIIFEAGKESYDPLPGKIMDLITRQFSLTIQALLVTPQELAEIISQNPFVEKPGIDFTKLHVTFIDRDADPVKAGKLLSYLYPPDEIITRKKAVYVYCPEGYGRTKYDNTFIEKKLSVNATTRNWNSCLRILEMCRERGHETTVTGIDE